MGLSVSNFTIENNSGRRVREDIDDCFKALQGQSAETTDLNSSQCVAGMTFLNTTSKLLKVRNFIETNRTTNFFGTNLKRCT